MDIIKNIQNHALKRQELLFKIESEKSPSFSEMKQKISEKFSKPEENIDVYGVKGSFGKKIFEVRANVYDSKKALENAIEMKKTQKQKKAEKKTAEEKASSAVAEEKAKADADAKKKTEDEKKVIETKEAEEAKAGETAA